MFRAPSAINEAALYSSIQNAKTTILLVNISKIGKAINLDKKVDNADGAYSGKVRWYPTGDGYVLTYIYRPHKMP